MAQPRTETAGRVPHSFFRVLRAVLRIALYALLIIAVLVVGSLGIWGQGKVETGVGEMSRLEAVRIYLHLMNQQPVWPCRMGYLMGILGTTLVPLQHIISAVRRDEDWSEIPRDAWEQILRLADGVLHRTVSCALPRPSDWTPELIGP